MGLRCLLGHDFGEVAVEREREEDGNEMVVTIREVKTCERCGERRIVSENKEVTSIKTPEEVGLEESTEEPEEPSHPAVEDDEPESVEAPDDPEADDGVILEDEPEPERAPGEWPDAEEPAGGESPPGEASATADAGSDPVDDELADPTVAEASDDEPAESTAGDATDAAESTAGEVTAPAEGEGEDVEFIDDAEPDAAGTEDVADAPAQSAAQASADSEAWPDPEGDDEGYDAEPGDGDGVSFGGNELTPDVEADAPEDDAEYVEADADRGRGTPSGVDSGIAREGSASVELSDAGGRPGEFYCPNCGLSRPAAESSMRAGDICPECRKGYITERDA